MAEPTDKNPEVLGEALRRDSIKADKCVPPPIGCGEPIGEFSDDASREEYRISGLCQKCQNAIFSEAIGGIDESMFGAADDDDEDAPPEA